MSDAARPPRPDRDFEKTFEMGFEVNIQMDAAAFLTTFVSY
jgi:hypothetical protein